MLGKFTRLRTFFSWSQLNLVVVKNIKSLTTLHLSPTCCSTQMLCPNSIIHTRAETISGLNTKSVDRRWGDNHFHNQISVSFTFQAEMPTSGCNQLLQCEDVLLYFALYHCKLNIFKFWTFNMKVSHWTLRDWDRNVSPFYFIDH